MELSEEPVFAVLEGRAVLELEGFDHPLELTREPPDASPEVIEFDAVWGEVWGQAFQRSGAWLKRSSRSARYRFQILGTHSRHSGQAFLL